MEKTASIMILYKFLKSINKYGTFKYYLVSDVPTSFNNVSVLKNFSKKIEETEPEDGQRRKGFFENMIGDMSGSISLGEDYLYYIYKDWLKYIHENWCKIDKEYLELKNNLKYERENIQNAKTWR